MDTPKNDTSLSIRQMMFNNLSSDTYLKNAETLGNEIVTEINALNDDIEKMISGHQTKFGGFEIDFDLDPRDDTKWSLFPGRITVSALLKESLDEQNFTPKMFAKITLALNALQTDMFEAKLEIFEPLYSPPTGQHPAKEEQTYDYADAAMPIKQVLTDTMMSILPRYIRVGLLNNYEEEQQAQGMAPPHANSNIG